MIEKVMQDPKWRNALNFLTELTGCTRFRAAALIVSGMREGYLPQE